MTPEEMLDQLAEYQAQRDALTLERDAQEQTILAAKRAEIEKYFTPEIKAKVDEIERMYEAQVDDLTAEYEGKSEAVDANIAKLEDEIKDAVKLRGETVKGKFRMAVFVQGRVSWDTKKLEGLMMVIPQVADARKEGEPSVSIRKI